MTGIVRYESTSLLVLFLKTNTLYTYNNFLAHTVVPAFTMKIIQNFFIKPFTKFFKKLVFTQYGMYTNNFTKSLCYHTVQNLLSLVPKQSPNLVKIYLHPIAVLNFSFHKSIYNTLIIYILFLITHVYLNNFTNFSL